MLLGVAAVNACLKVMRFEQDAVSITRQWPAARIAPGLIMVSAPKRAWGMPGAQYTRSPVRAGGSELCARVFTAEAPESPGIPARDWF